MGGKMNFHVFFDGVFRITANTPGEAERLAHARLLGLQDVQEYSTSRAAEVGV